MRNSINLSVLIIFLFFCISVYADCPFKDIEKYSETESGLCYKDTQIYQGKALEFSNYLSGERASFMVYNPNEFEVSAFFTFQVEGMADNTTVFGIKIPSNDYGKVQKICYDGTSFVNCSIIPDSVKYYVNKPDLMYPCTTNVQKSREVCNKPCEKDADCSSTICNRAGFCGPVWNVSCPENKKECGDLCTIPGNKKAGETCSCEWECNSNTCTDNICKSQDGVACQSNIECVSSNCNFLGVCGAAICPNGTQNCEDKQCVQPTKKKSGEEYLCLWECESGRGKDGVCGQSLTTIASIIIFLITALGMGLYFLIKALNAKHWTRTGKNIRNKIIKTAKTESDAIIHTAREKAEKIISDAETKLEMLNHELESKNKIRDKIEDELKSATKKSEKARQLRQELEEINQDIEELTDKQIRKREKLKEEREQLTKERLTPFTNKQGYRVYINENGYEVLERTGTLFHRWWFEHNHNRRIKEGHEIHHMDFKKRNNDIDNLEELRKDEHEMKHMNRYR
jgi:hypothetical protein